MEKDDFTIYSPEMNGKGEYEPIPYSFYGSVKAFSNKADLMEFLRHSFLTEEECISWISKQASTSIERTWLYLVDRVLTWRDGISQNLDNPRVQELARELQKEFEDKLVKR